MRLKDKVVLVTGGSKGIGRATVEAMAREGANIVLNYASDQKAADDTKEAAAQLVQRWS